MTFLSVQHLIKSQAGNIAVNDLGFTMDTHTKLAIAGQTGSGKTSLLKMIAGLLQPDSGNVFLNGTRITGPDEQLIPGHKSIAYLSQYFELRNHYFVYELMNMANQLKDDAAKEIFSICRIDHLLHRRTNELSGGEKQRIVLAKLLITRPKLLLLDEPFSHLDQLHKKTMKAVLAELSARMKIHCIMVTHEVNEILSWADQLIILKDGKIIQKDIPSTVFYEPVNEYAAGILGDYNLIDPALINASEIGMDTSPEKKLFFRPSQIQFAENDDRSFEGEIVETVFYADYYAYRIRIKDTDILLTDAGSPRSTGLVKLSLKDSVHVML